MRPADSVAVERLAEQVRAAASARQALRIRAGGTKDFYGNATAGECLDPRPHAGIIDYEPTELVIRARAGTPLAEIESTLAACGQMLAFEPPHFGAGATLGGCVAAGLAGPRRAAAGFASGGVREAVLGAALLDGRGQQLRFGGNVIKNVAGYDVSRLLVGSLGTLGVLLEVAVRVVPVPSAELTCRLAGEQEWALESGCRWIGAGWPVSATAWHDGQLHVRFSGSAGSVEAAARAVGGERLAPPDAHAFWTSVREHGHAFFGASAPLWRVAVPGGLPPLGLPGSELIEWAGMQRWLQTPADAGTVRSRAAALGGHATLFRGGLAGVPAFTPLDAPLARINARLRAEFDPAAIFNPGRMHAN